MPRVLGLHLIALKPGVTGEQLERFWREELTPGPPIPGVKSHLLKCVRGDRDGRYAVLIEIESVEAYNHHFPTSRTWSDEVEQFWAARAAARAKWDTLASSFPDPLVNDYLIVGE